MNIERRVDPATVSRPASRITVRTTPDPTGKGTSRREVLHFTLTDYQVLEAWGGTAAVRIQPSTMSRVHALAPLQPIVSGYYLRVAWTLGQADILAVEES